MSQTFKLYRLQQLDSQLDQIAMRSKEIEIALSNDETKQQAQGEADQAEAALQIAVKALGKAEDALMTQRLKIEQNEASLYGGKIRNPKELQDLENDVASLKRYRSVLEDRLLEAMLNEEEASSAFQSASLKLDEVCARLSQQQKALLEEKAKLDADTLHLVSERGATAATIPESDLELYDLLRKQRRGIAVSKVNTGTCSACGSVLNTALLSAARSPNQITRCDVCGRILYGG
jgi:hypothetical protein